MDQLAEFGDGKLVFGDHELFHATPQAIRGVYRTVVEGERFRPRFCRGSEGVVALQKSRLTRSGPTAGNGAGVASYFEPTVPGGTRLGSRRRQPSAVTRHILPKLLPNAPMETSSRTGVTNCAGVSAHRSNCSTTCSSRCSCCSPRCSIARACRSGLCRDSRGSCSQGAITKSIRDWRSSGRAMRPVAPRARFNDCWSAFAKTMNLPRRSRCR